MGVLAEGFGEFNSTCTRSSARRIVTRVLAALALLALTSNAAVGQADPDAKGTVTCSVQVAANSNSITISGTRTAVAGWSVGAVTYLFVKQGGGLIRNAVVPIPGGEGGPPANWSIIVPGVPNGDYYAYAYHNPSRTLNGVTEYQQVGSPLATFTVNMANNTTTETVGGTIAFAQGKPARQNGGATMYGEGTFTINQWYERITNESGVSIEMVAIPVNGGVVRTGAALVIGN